MKKFRRMTSMAAALAISAGAIAAPAPKTITADAAYGVGGTGKNIVEYLNRGITAINTGNGMLVFWIILIIIIVLGIVVVVIAFIYKRKKANAK